MSLLTLQKTAFQSLPFHIPTIVCHPFFGDALCSNKILRTNSYWCPNIEVYNKKDQFQKINYYNRM